MNIAQWGHPVDGQKTAINPDLMETQGLSFRAKGILLYLIANPSVLQKTKTQAIELLRNGAADGAESCRSGLNELIKAGFIPEWNGRVAPVVAQYGKPGFVYVLREEETGLYKIGSSKNPRQRARAINNQRRGSVSLVCAIQCGDMGRLEGDAHKCFSGYRQDGEWFLLPDQIANGIEDALTELAGKCLG